LPEVETEVVIDSTVDMSEVKVFTDLDNIQEERDHWDYGSGKDYRPI